VTFSRIKFRGNALTGYGVFNVHTDGRTGGS